MITNNFTKYLLGISMILISISLSAQQTEIEYNSNTTTAGPQLLIQETDAGDGSGMNDDGWARMWFKNTADPVNRWGFLARPHAGATDNPDSLMSPLVMAYTGVQKFGFGKDGTLRINKKYSLPNVDGTNGQVLTTDGAGNVSWAAGGGSGSSSLIVDNDVDTKVELIEAISDSINFEIDGNRRFSMTDGYTTNNSTHLHLFNDFSKTGVQESMIFFKDDSEIFNLGGLGINEASGSKVLDMFGDDRVSIRGGYNDSGLEARMYIGKFGTTSGTVFTSDGGSSPNTTNATVDVRGDLTAEEINVNDEYTFPTTDGTNGQIMTTDGSGNVSWAAGATSSPWTELGTNVRFTDSNLVTVQANSTTGNTGFSFLEDGLRESFIWHEKSSGDLNFTATNSSSARHLVIDGATQNVGIGLSNTAPTQKLDVKVTGNDGIRIEGNNTGDARLSIENGGGIHYLFDDDNDGHDLKLQSANDLAFLTNGVNERMKILGNGEIGINTAPNVNYRMRVATSNDIYAFEGRYEGTGTGYGARGVNVSSGNQTKYGLYGSVGSLGGGNRYGVYGVASTTPLNSYAIYAAGNIYHTGTITGPSDERLKKNIQPMQSVLDKVMSLETKTYEFKTDENPYMNLASGPQVGFISQQVQEVLPNLVVSSNHTFTTEENEEGVESTIEEEILSLNTMGMVPILTKAIQEQQEIIEDVKAENAELKSQIAAILERLDSEEK